MIPYLGCELAREMLQPFIDGELPMAEQVALESHLRWCRVCAAHVDDLRLIGDSIRTGAPINLRHEDARVLAGLQAGVLNRIRVERDHSLAVTVRGLFDDWNLFWAGLGATTALVVCLFGTMSVLHAATSDEKPDSLAGIIESLANPGSDSNPMRLDAFVSPPTAIDDSPAPALDKIPEDEAVFALAAVVTREGRIANYALLSERDGPQSQKDVTALLDAVARSRFAPAQRGDAPVAVNVVWLLARTTVKGKPLPLDFEIRTPWRPDEPEVLPAAPESKPPDVLPSRPGPASSSTV